MTNKTKYIDSHAHLFSSNYRNDLSEVISRAEDVGVESIIVPATDVKTSRESIELAEKYDAIYACVGIHPHDASKAKEGDIVEIENLSRHPKVVGIGEIGLDFFYDFSPRETQTKLYEDQIHIAVRRDLPIVVHTRDSIDEAVSIVENAISKHSTWRQGNSNFRGTVPGARGVFHCFSGNDQHAWRLIRQGFYISFPGIVTFKQSPVIQTLEQIGYDHLLLETDSPYMTPAPHRGKRNEPSNVIFIAEKISEIFDTSLEDVARTTVFNTKRLFSIGPPAEPTIAYKLGNSLYLNITIRCNADCIFCDRKGEAIVKGHSLKITKEPTVEEIISAIGNPTQHDEVVFCGYGEPTIKLDVIKEVSSWVKANGGKVRLNTDGHGNIINKRNIVPELVGLIDAVSISFNTSDPVQYGELMQIDGDKYHKAMIDFALECKKLLPKVIMTIVDMPEIDVEKARRVIENDLGLEYKARPYF